VVGIDGEGGMAGGRLSMASQGGQHQRQPAQTLTPSVSIAGVRANAGTALSWRDSRCSTQVVALRGCLSISTVRDWTASQPALLAPDFNQAVVPLAPRKQR
jgi:hypothetical protein